MAARTIDQNEIIVRLKPRHGHRQAMVENVFTLFQRRRIDFGQLVIGGCRQGQPLFTEKLGAIFDVAAKRLLAQVQIERANLMPHARQCRCHVHRHGGLARPALFVPHDDNMCHCLCPYVLTRIVVQIVGVTIRRRGRKAKRD